MSLFASIGSYEDAWKAIIMPSRQEYGTYDLGPTEFHVKDKRIKRSDFRLLNKRGQTIECSFFQEKNLEKAVPCVVYLHGNGCSRIESLHYLEMILSKSVSFFCFDFTGCGKSEGLYTSVGWHEQDDLECVIEYLSNLEKVSKIAVWGRSMGAITAMLYAGRDPRITCFIFDSPFSNFKQLVKELAKQKASIPGFIAAGAFSILRKTILSKANFDIDSLKPIKYVDKIKMPALFGAAKDDTFVSPQHTRDLYLAYGGPKQLLIFDGDHNSQRPINWMMSVQEFVKIHLLEEKAESQNPVKSFKQQFNPTEKVTLPIFEPLGERKPNLEPHHHSHPVKTVSPPRHHIQQNHMNFSWLDHSASSPNLNTAVPSQESLTDKVIASKEPATTKEYENQGAMKEQLVAKDHVPGEEKQEEKVVVNEAKPKYGEKRLQHLFADSKKENIVPTKAHKSIFQHFHKSASTPAENQGVDLVGNEKVSKLSLKHQAIPVKQVKGKDVQNAENQSSASNRAGVSIFGPKEIEINKEEMFESPTRKSHTTKPRIPLKDTSSINLNKATESHPSTKVNQLNILDLNKSKSSSQELSPPDLTPQSSQASQESMKNVFSNAIPPPRRINSQRESKKIFEKEKEAQQKSGVAAHSPSSKSFTIDLEESLGNSKEMSSPVQKQKKTSLLLQFKLNSDVPIITPAQAHKDIHHLTQSLTNINVVEERRSSEAVRKLINRLPLEDIHKNNSSKETELKSNDANRKSHVSGKENQASVRKTTGELSVKGNQKIDIRKSHKLVK